MSESFGDRLRAFDIEDYLSRYGRVVKSGADHRSMAKCPLCGDSHRKFYVNIGKRRGTWNSYCCHKSGGVIELVCEIEGITRREAVAMILDGQDENGLIGVDPNEFISGPMQQRELAPDLETLPGPYALATPEMPCMIKGRPGTLRQRGCDEYIISRHGLVVTGGMTFYRGKHRPDLNCRLVWSVRGPGGAALGWQARDLSGTAEAKYLFPTGNRVTEWFYGLQDFAGDTLLIVEGCFHKWAWDRLGRATGRPLFERFSAASFGKKLTEEQIKLLIAAENIKNVIFGWDLDAGEAVAKYGAELKGYKKVYVMPSMPDSRDHDELSHQEMIHILSSCAELTDELAVKLTVQSRQIKSLKAA